MKGQSWAKAALANSKSDSLSRLILVTMAEACSPEGCVCLSLSELSHFTGLSKSSIRRRLLELESLHEIHILSEPKGRACGCYKLTFRRTKLFHRVVPQTTLPARRVVTGYTQTAI